MEKKNMLNRIEKAKLGAKRKARQVWNWSKDHWAELLLGGLAVGGGAYLLTRDKGGSTEGNDAPVTCSQIDYDVDAVDERIQQAWDDCNQASSEPYMGPTED